MRCPMFEKCSGEVKSEEKCQIYKRNLFVCFSEAEGVEVAISLKSIHAEFLARFPEIHTEHRCFVDSVYGYPSCVWDEDSPEGSDDCSASSRGIKKDDCEYWKKATIHNQYCPDTLWEWMNSMLSGQDETRE